MRCRAADEGDHVLDRRSSSVPSPGRALRSNVPRGAQNTRTLCAGSRSSGEASTGRFPDPPHPAAAPGSRAREPSASVPSRSAHHRAGRCPPRHASPIHSASEPRSRSSPLGILLCKTLSGNGRDRQDRGPAALMRAFVVQNHPYRAFADFGRIPVRCFAHDAPSYSGVGASGKPGAVQRSARSVFRRLYRACRWHRSPGVMR